MLLGCCLLAASLLTRLSSLTSFRSSRGWALLGRQGTCLLSSVLDDQLIVLDSHGVGESESER